MPKMQVYLPDELYEQLKHTGCEINVSGVLQEALTQRLAHIERIRLLREALSDYEQEQGLLTPEEVDAQEALDKKSAVRPKTKRKRQPAA
jgi:post-segregation antitoxin (ccd killing protein)